MTLYPKLIVDALATVVYPGTKKNLIESEMLADTPSIDGMNVRIVLVFPRDTDPFLRSTVKAAEAAIHYHISPDVKVTIETEFKSKPRPEVGKMLPNVKNIIAVRFFIAALNCDGRSEIDACLSKICRRTSMDTEIVCYFINK